MWNNKYGANKKTSWTYFDAERIRVSLQFMINFFGLCHADAIGSLHDALRCMSRVTCHVSSPGSGYWRCVAYPTSEPEAGDNLTETGGGFSAASPGRVELLRQVCCHHCFLYPHLYHHNQCCQESQRSLDKSTFLLAPLLQMSDTNH